MPRADSWLSYAMDVVVVVGVPILSGGKLFGKSSIRSGHVYVSIISVSSRIWFGKCRQQRKAFTLSSFKPSDCLLFIPFGTSMFFIVFSRFFFHYHHLILLIRVLCSYSLSFIHSFWLAALFRICIRILCTRTHILWFVCRNRSGNLLLLWKKSYPYNQWRIHKNCYYYYHLFIWHRRFSFSIFPPFCLRMWIVASSQERLLKNAAYPNRQRRRQSKAKKNQQRVGDDEKKVFCESHIELWSNGNGSTTTNVK